MALASRRRSDESTRRATWTGVEAQANRALRDLAFPPSRTARDDAARRLDAVGRTLHALSPAERRRGDDSGLDGTTTRHGFDLGIAEWLAARAPRDVDVDWSAPTASTAVAQLLRPALRHVEEEGFDSDTLTVHAWIRRARGAAWPSDLAWILDALRDTGDSLARRAVAWEDAAVPLRWRLRGVGVDAARTSPPRIVTRRSLRTAPQHVARFVASGTPGSQRLALVRGAAARALIDRARETLASRGREVHALSFANEREVWSADLGAGTSIAVIGVLPALRLSLEANYAFLLSANGVPIGYGGVSPLFAQANTGINLFPAFRGTEASALWARALRIFHALFGSRRFLVSPYQIGEGNDEALASGAFWFYYRLGFRPTAARVAELAASEAMRRTASEARTPRAVQRQLARADLELTLPGWSPSQAFDERWLARLSLLASAHIAAEGHLERHAALDRITARVASSLGIHLGALDLDRRDALRDLAPLVELARQGAAGRDVPRTAWRRWVLAKGRPRERDFALASVAVLPAIRALATAPADPRPASRAASASGRRSSPRSTPRTP